MEKVWGSFAYMWCNFVSRFSCFVCVAPLILKRGFHFALSRRGDTRALRGCGFFGALVCLLRVGLFFLPLCKCCGKLCRIVWGWGWSCPVSCFILFYVCFVLGEDVPLNQRGGIGLFVTLSLSLVCLVCGGKWWCKKSNYWFTFLWYKSNYCLTISEKFMQIFILLVQLAPIN